MRKEVNKIIAVLVSISVLIVLVFAGGVNGLNISLSSFPSTAYKGDMISSKATVDLSANEKVDWIAVYIDGKLECSVSSPGGDCNSRGIIVRLEDSTNFGYGYGSRATYNITVDSQKYSVGSHKIQIKAYSGDLVFKSNEKSVSFLPKGQKGK